MNVGVLGAGQLGRMLALAGYPMGLRFHFLDSASEAPARHVGAWERGDFEHEPTLARFAERVQAATLEWENVPVSAAEYFARRVPFCPPPAALAIAQDRSSEKALFERLGIPTPEYRNVATMAELHTAAHELGLPAVLKTRRYGYDGKGQAVLRGTDELDSAWRSLAGQPAILERLVPFERELSLLAVRGQKGEEAYYPLVENQHREGILRVSRAPAPFATGLQETAESYARSILVALDYVGVLALELFQQGGRLLANEIAPRVHNSGHWTIEGAVTSQFENHLRALLGWPLGGTAARGECVMVNLIGVAPDPALLAAIPGLHLHLYDKTARAGRKLGHVTFVGETRASGDAFLARVSGLMEAV